MNTPYFLEIKQSPIHGLGVFTKEFITADTLIGFFEGVKYSLKEFKALYGTDYRYCFRATRANYILCAKDNRNFITYINESRTPNVVLKSKSLYALVDIPAGTELLLYYGKKYPRDYSLETNP